MAHDMSEPGKFTSLYSHQDGFLRSNQGMDSVLHTLIGFALDVQDP